MASPYELMVKLQGVRNSILDETENIIYRNENKIIQLNSSQIEQHIGFDNKKLENTVIVVYKLSNKRFISFKCFY